jgi:hypothetical protein
MKKMITLLLMVSALLVCHGQEEESHTERQETQLEQQLMRDESIQEDDMQWQESDHYRRSPLRLNTATAADLQSLQLLHPWQIRSLLLYRKTFGKLLSIYELQAVPGWNQETILKVLPYISISPDEATRLPFFQRFKGGDGNLLVRSGKLLSTEGPSSFIRYRYRHTKQMQWGFTAEKDAGEAFFKGAQRNGFDFYSFHLFAQRAGPFRVLALGDFQVNMGQGLIQWQGMSYAYSAVLSLKKQSEVLQPYSSAGEFNFHRGVGISIGDGPLQVMAFGSYRKLSAHLQEDSTGTYFHNFVSSGYHRTASEQKARQTISLLTTGGSVRWRKTAWQLGLNAVQYHFAIPMKRPPALYRLFAIEGKRWFNTSVDYGITIRNIHFFGEYAMDKNHAWAFTSGLLCSVLPSLQAGISYRSFSKQFQSMFSSAVSQSAAPSNEEGISMRLEWQPSRKWKVQATADLFRFPWLKYRVDAPANGYEHLLLIVHQPSRKIMLQCRYQLSSKPVNQSDSLALKFPAWQQRRQWRMQWSWEMNGKWKLTQRTDYLVAGSRGAAKEAGISCWLEAGFKPDRRWLLNARLHFYETGSYQSRIYSYERDLLYSYAMPAFSGNSIRAYMLIRYKFSPVKTALKRYLTAECWIKYAIALRPEGGIEQEKEAGNNASNEFRLQWLFRFH